MIEVEESIDVPAPVAVVWKFISDPHEVVSCIDGAELLADESNDGSYRGSMPVRFGPLRISFRGRIKLEYDEENLTGTITATGSDAQGGTRFKSTISFLLIPLADTSRLTIEGTVELWGKLASVVETGAAAVVKRMVGEFSQEFAHRVAPGPVLPNSDRPLSPRARAWGPLASFVWRVLSRLGFRRFR